MKVHNFFVRRPCSWWNIVAILFILVYLNHDFYKILCCAVFTRKLYLKNKGNLIKEGLIKVTEEKIQCDGSKFLAFFLLNLLSDFLQNA